jgi:PadR family transcriptional regulator, regulatory protein PadR
VNVTLPTTLVLQALARGHRHGFDVMDATGLPSGTVYPMLRRLEKEGLVRAKWEAPETARDEQRPPRRYYELTGEGEALLVTAKARYRMPSDIPRARGFKHRPSES